MSGRNRKDDPPKSRMQTYFVPGAGIDREVITTDICRHLGNDALVKPGSYEDPRTGEVRAGYFVTAYRALTTAQLADIKADSLRWQQERQRNPQASRSATGDAGYRGSVTRRQQWGPADPPAPEPTMGGGYGGGRDPREMAYPGAGQPNPGYQGMMPQQPSYSGNPQFPSEAPNYSGYETRPSPVEVQYSVAPARDPRENPAQRMQAQYPGSGSYATAEPPRNPVIQGYQTGGYAAPYPAGQGGAAQLPGVRQQPATGYEASYTTQQHQPPDRGYGRNQAVAPPTTEEDLANPEYAEDEPMDEDDPEEYPTQRHEVRRTDAPRAREERTRTPPSKSSRSHHSERHRR